jgi:hypothetical protein
VLGTQGSSVASKLVVVIDNHSQRIAARYRFHVTVRLVTRLVLVIFACSWLFLYLDSVYQRRRVESLVADLKSLDFATAGFPEIRDLVIRNGGIAVHRDSLPTLPDFGNPLPSDPRGNLVFNRPGPVCTRQNCNFQLFISSRLAQLPFPIQERTEELLYSALPYIGVRTWCLGAIFEVRKGKLERSEMSVWDFRVDRLGLEYPRRLIPLGYKVETVVRDSPRFDLCRNQDYRVFLDHGHPVKFPGNVLHTCVLQTASTPIKRAFDMNLRCLNGIFHGCRFDELAPSAWADYSAKGDGKGASDPYK